MMKNSLIKKFLCILLSVVMIMPLYIIGVSSAQVFSKKDCPHIDIHGFMAVDLLADKNDPDSEAIWPPATDDILNAVKKAIPAIANLSVTWNWDKFTDTLIPVVNDLFYKSELDEYGKPVLPDSGVAFDPIPNEGQIKNGETLNFLYDWRLDPYETADELAEYIDNVLEKSGKTQVTLSAHSLGGIIMLTYLIKYGYSKVRSVCFNTTAIYGETYTGELLSGNIQLDATALQNYLKFIFSENDYEYLLNSTVNMLKKAGLLDFVCKFGNLMIDKIKGRVIPEVLVPFFAHWLTIWAMVPDEYIDGCIDYVFNDVLKDSEKDYSVLKQRINRYNTEIRAKRDDTLKEINGNKGISIYVISRYGFVSVPLSPGYDNMSDGVIDTKYSSFGATTAKYGEILDKNSILNDGKYLSPDGTIDASTCLFPEQTWFIKNYKHAETGKGLRKMIEDLLYYNEGQASIDSIEGYPQYLEYVASDESLIPDIGTEKADLNFLQRIKAFFSEYFKLIKSIFMKIKIK